MVKITADSTCDLSADMLENLRITVMPLIVLIDGKTFYDGVDIMPADIFRYVDLEGKTCKTAAVNTYEYESFFRRFSSEYEAVIHICLGSGFSSCYQNATMAAEKFDNVYVLDSQNLSSGSGHAVYEAALMALNGAGAHEICRSLEDLISRVDASFVIEQLDYLHKGGRCSGIELLGTKMLQIKPCIEVVNGEMIVGKKYRGSFDRCLDQYVKDKLYNKQNIDYSRVFITHPMCSAKTIEKVKAAVCQYACFDSVIETPAGCTVSSHCGPHTLGILFKRTDKKTHV
ncbi:MAG: DegV family protein [Dehalobacter sp. 4CP]|nr:DegV family protein [Dehalobacter sp. 4CP]